jgi:CO/xanthine dehydrogenase Mo-binding subunit
MSRSFVRCFGPAASATLLFGSGAGADPATDPAPPTQSALPALAINTMTEDAVSASARRLLRDKLIADADLRLISRQPMTWSDSSLGCRTPGAMYTQAQVSGFALRFANADRSYDVHVAGENTVLCPFTTGAPKRPLRTPVSVRTLNLMVEKARADLAQRLSIPMAEITRKNLQPASWDNADLGCASGAALTAGVVRGYRILLSARGGEYIYHTDFTRVMVCPPIETY